MPEGRLVTAATIELNVDGLLEGLGETTPSK